MERHDPSRYGDRIAGIYDELFGGMLDTENAVELLASLAAGGAALELGIGTGRLAIPLAERGTEVHGIDASEAMVARMRAKPGGDRIPVTIGDFREVPVEGRFRLVFVAFNTIFALLTQEDQIACFRAAAERVEPAGALLLECFVPDMTRWQEHQHTGTVRVEEDRVLLSASRHDPVLQRIDTQLLLLGVDGVRQYPVRIRYAWPSELDVMARLAGLRLRDRWGGWDRRPFDSSSHAHVSVYTHAEA